MCFNKELSLLFCFTSLGVAFWAMTGKGLWKDMEVWRRHRIEACFAYFCFMEFLQFVQYQVIDQCDNPINEISTALGYLHICFQPLFTNLIMSALDRKNLDKSRDMIWQYIFKFCFLLSFFMSARLIIPMVLTPDSVGVDKYFKPCFREMDGLCAEKDSWKTCSTTGVYHIRWNFKLLRSSYLMPNIGLHFITMFLVPFAMGMRFESILLLLSGPALTTFLPIDDGERSSIWCYFSVMEELITFGSQIVSIHLSRKKKDNAPAASEKAKRVKHSHVSVRQN